MIRVPLWELFAGELRRLRTDAGLTQEALGERVSYSASLVAAVEQCRRAPRAEFTERCDEVLNGGGLLVRIRDALMQEALMPWFREWVSIEQEATALRSFQPLVVPGLLQTEGYARALHEGASPLVGDAMEQQVAARLARQSVLDRPAPPQFVAVLDHSVLARAVGGPKVMQEQLAHLVEMGRRPRVHLHLVPETVGSYPGLNGAFVLATPADGDDVGYLDNQLHGTIVERHADVKSLRQTWESVRAEAMPHGATLAAISEAAKRWS
ncbi:MULTISPECIES: helix-turn-helix transcriptional regulator [unclassified Micromonospora]|uniref:helix-turn-helix domain-containing protein n=1 Tax=unclassified Micromonospora TaxID=2617518 RepID=UPI001C212DD5|nr:MULTISPECIES: helix-turn-helix transcriptional regulator [unclassified Micromonospora]MBU8858508.1 helix-turn-helix domain-containing protein [Micromonospora sp. WMMB482]MDM4784151.1 helix-turn-helix transcriptional regulator [Micromonospora sp. b486]